MDRGSPFFISFDFIFVTMNANLASLSPSPLAFDEVINGKLCRLFHLHNAAADIHVWITNYGGKMVALTAPDRNGDPANVLLGYPSLKKYRNGNPYFGALIGPVANRIANAGFFLQKEKITLESNDGPNCLHSGLSGFHNQVWDIVDYGKDYLALRYVRGHGEGGFPGKLVVDVRFVLGTNNDLSIIYHAVTDRTTAVSLTNHNYYNLAGEGREDVLQHIAQIHADTILPVDANLCPIGDFMPVEHTPFDFRKPKAIGKEIEDAHQQLILGLGYDHTFCLTKKRNEMVEAAVITDPLSGRSVTVNTTEPGAQFYTGNYLNGKDRGLRNTPYIYRGGFCFETQQFPNALNISHFPTILLKPEDFYTQTTVIKFSVH